MRGVSGRWKRGEDYDARGERGRRGLGRQGGWLAKGVGGGRRRQTRREVGASGRVGRVDVSDVGQSGSCWSGTCFEEGVHKGASNKEGRQGRTRAHWKVSGRSVF